MLWSEVVEKSERLDVQRKQVFREEVQKAVLSALSTKGCFNSIVFHGGTALRLFYGNPRLSEDIDLVMVDVQAGFDLSGYMPFVERFIIDTFPFLDSVEVKPQKSSDIQRSILRTRSGDRDQTLRLNLELAAIPSYHNQPRILDFPPLQPVVRVEDSIEILADKVCALAFRPYLKGRDLWDIHFLTKERSLKVDWHLVVRKVGDYNKPVNELAGRLESAKERISKEGISILTNEMERFLPQMVLEQYRPAFVSVLGSVLEVISEHDGGKEDEGR